MRQTRNYTCFRDRRLTVGRQRPRDEIRIRRISRGIGEADTGTTSNNLGRTQPFTSLCHVGKTQRGAEPDSPSQVLCLFKPLHGVNQFHCPLVRRYFALQLVDGSAERLTKTFGPLDVTF